MRTGNPSRNSATSLSVIISSTARSFVSGDRTASTSPAFTVAPAPTCNKRTMRPAAGERTTCCVARWPTLLCSMRSFWMSASILATDSRALSMVAPIASSVAAVSDVTFAWSSCAVRTSFAATSRAAIARSISVCTRSTSRPARFLSRFPTVASRIATLSARSARSTSVLRLTKSFSAISESRFERSPSSKSVFIRSL